MVSEVGDVDTDTDSHIVTVTEAHLHYGYRWGTRTVTQAVTQALTQALTQTLTQTLIQTQTLCVNDTLELSHLHHGCRCRRPVSEAELATSSTAAAAPATSHLLLTLNPAEGRVRKPHPPLLLPYVVKLDGLLGVEADGLDQGHGEGVEGE